MGERLKAGDTFAGIYFLKTLLGEGGMGQVWRAWHVQHERDVALKTIIPNVRPSEQELFREHFLQEAQVVLRLSHKNIVAVYDRGEHEGILYFTMQFVNGGMDMEHVLRRSPGNRLPWPLACHGIGQLLEGLTEAHRQKIVHRDVKPANLMVDPRGYSLLMDFGVAKQLTATFSVKTHAKGTDGFMPPDGYRLGVGYSVASDIFSVGAMLRRMIVGSNVLTDGITMHEEVVGRLLRLEHEALPSIASSGVECPPEVEAFVARCMAWEPRDRFRDAAEAHDAFYPLTRFAGDRDMVAHVRVLPTQLSASAGAPIGVAEAVPEPIATHGPGDTPIHPGTPLQPRAAPPPPEPVPATGSLHGQVIDASPAPRRARRKRPLLLGAAIVAVGSLVALFLLTRDPGTMNHAANAPVAPATVVPVPDAAAPPPSPPDATTVVVDAAPEVVVAPAAVPEVEPPRPEPVPAPDRPAPRGVGELVIKTRGGAPVVVYLDGKRKGVAPLRLQGIPAGRHALTFENDETNEKKRMRVEVKAGTAKAVETGW